MRHRRLLFTGLFHIVGLFTLAAIPCVTMWVGSAAAAPAVPIVKPGRLPRSAPEAVGMSSDRLARIDYVLERAIAADGFPGAAVIVGRRGAIVWEKGYGHLDWTGASGVSAESTLYDVASLTKVVATSAAVMALVDRGRLGLRDPVGRYISEFNRGDKAQITIQDLLTHRSGLPAGRELGRGGSSVADARRAVVTTPLEAMPGARTEYSDLGPDALGFVIERVSGQPLDLFTRRYVYDPLGMSATMFRPPTAFRSRIAPTITPASRGIVHDGNARALGGVAGHAGLFSTAADLATFAQTMLNHGSFGSVRIADDSTVARFTRRTAGWRALGWDTCAGGGSCGHYMDSTAFGHTGFTGTSMWVDPEREMFVIVLTNWVFGGPDGRVAPVAVLHDVQADVADIAALAVESDSGELPAILSRLRSEMRIGWYP
jgi:serine-type D-Ala-D-Ala carboxypeptidase